MGNSTKAIWDVLHPEYMALPTQERWKLIAERFFELWNLPNCLGSIDGKHIRIQKLPSTGSENFNYKSFHSLILLACGDADGIFTTVEVGFCGRNSDGGVFQASKLGECLRKGRLNIPSDSVLPHSATNFPFYFVADEAFPLQRNLMRPYPQRSLTNTKRVFNYRLSRGRRTIECAFGMMVQKFQVLKSAIQCKSEHKIIHIIKACCVLHNFIRKREGRAYQLSADSEVNITARPARIREEKPPRRANAAQILRTKLANYFISEAGSLPWQWKNIV